MSVVSGCFCSCFPSSKCRAAHNNGCVYFFLPSPQSHKHSEILSSCTSIPYFPPSLPPTYPLKGGIAPTKAPIVHPNVGGFNSFFTALEPANRLTLANTNMAGSRAQSCCICCWR